MFNFKDPNWPAVVRAAQRRKKLGPNAAEIANRHWRTYAMTVNQIQDLHRMQDGRCANPGCRIPIRLLGRTRAVDHDHKTGAVRGMLCKNCNFALGLLYDDVKRINGLVKYLAGNEFVTEAFLEVLTQAQWPKPKKPQNVLFQK